MNLTKWLSKGEGSLLESKEKNTSMVIMMMKVLNLKNLNGKKQDRN